MTAHTQDSTLAELRMKAFETFETEPTSLAGSIADTTVKARKEKQVEVQQDYWAQLEKKLNDTKNRVDDRTPSTGSISELVDLAKTSEPLQMFIEEDTQTALRMWERIDYRYSLLNTPSKHHSVLINDWGVSISAAATVRELQMKNKLNTVRLEIVKPAALATSAAKAEREMTIKESKIGTEYLYGKFQTRDYSDRYFRCQITTSGQIMRWQKITKHAYKKAQQFAAF